MENLSATEAARRFSKLLDEVENRGETFIIHRHGRPVARIGPTPVANGAQVKALLRRWRPDPEWAEELRELRASLRVQQR